MKLRSLAQRQYLLYSLQNDARMIMAYQKKLLLLLLFWFVVDTSHAAPIPNYDIFPHFELPQVFSGPFIILVSAGFLVACAVIIFGCTCCQRKNVQEINDQNRRVLGQLNDNLAALQTGSEFAIFPPSSTAINLQPLYTSSLFGNEGDKVIFEPLPDILPKRHINGQNLAQSSKPAHFSMLLRRKSSLHDWFDDPNSNFPRSQLQYFQEIGNGWFGRVVEGEAQMIVDGQERTPVIVKILREEATPSEHLYFLHDIRPYRDLQHPNVLRLLGRCLETDPFLLIMEHSNTNLKTFLINQQENSHKQSSEENEQLLQIICGVTAGLSHMHENNFTHSDLAARNCFIGMNNIVKVGDYGLSLEMFREEYYCVGDLALPVRWLAPEALNCSERAIESRDTTKESNIWSLGVLFWEVFELGQLPYSTLTNEEVLQKVILEKSLHLQEPTLSHPYKMQMYQIMELCWRPSECRPDVQVIEMLLKQLSRHKESSETFSSFEQRWNALQNKASLFTANAPMKFENDFISSYSPHSHSLFNESISDSSCEPFHEGVESCRSPSLRALNGSFDELQPDDGDQLSASLRSSLQENSRREFEVVTPEQITEAIRDFDAMLASEALMLGVDSRSATLERPSSSHEKKDVFTDENADGGCANDVTSMPILKNHAEMPVLSECTEDNYSEVTESKCYLNEQVPVQNDVISSNSIPSLPSSYEDSNTSAVNTKTESSTPLPDILVTQSSHCQNSDDDQNSEEQSEYVNLFQPVQNYYHFVMKDDLGSEMDSVNQSESNIPPDIIEACEHSIDDSSKSCSSDPVTSTPSKSQEFYSLLMDESFSSSKISKDVFPEGCVTSSSESKSYYESVNTMSSNEENSGSFKTAATSLARDSEGNTNYQTINDDSLHKASLVSDENVTSISENSFFSANTSNVKSDVLPKDHSHSEDYYSTLENSPALSEKTISMGNDDEGSHTPDLINVEQTFSMDFEPDPISEDSDMNANNVISNQKEVSETTNQTLLAAQTEMEEDSTIKEDFTDCPQESSSNQISLLDESSIIKKIPCHLEESNSAAKSPPVSSHSAWNANETRHDLVNENLVSGPCDHVSAESSFIFHKPYLDLQEDPELESSSVVSDSFIFIKDPENRPDDLAEKCSRVMAWSDHNKIIVSDLSDIDEVESENSSPDYRKRYASTSNKNCESSFSSNLNINFEELNQRCNFRNPVEMNCIDEYDDNDDEEDDQIEADDVLKIDTETNEAILVDRSESLVGFVPSRSIELLQEYDCIASRLDSADNLRNAYTNNDISDDEAGDISMHMCNGSITNDVNNLSLFLENTEYSDDEVLKSDKTGDSTGEEYDRSPIKSRQLPRSDVNFDYTEYRLNEINDTEHIVQCNDENDNVSSDLYNDIVLSNQPTKSVIWHSDETLDVLKDEDDIGPVIIESEEILAGHHNKNNNLEDNLSSQIQFGSSDFLDRLIVSSTSSPNCSAASTPCRDIVYTPDFESESEDSTSSCSSTSGSFECIHNKFKDVTDISMESAKKEDSPISEKTSDMSPLKVFSKTWDCQATPNKSLLKSPEKKVLPIRKSVSFHEDPQLVFQYPPASDSSEDERDSDYFHRVDYTSYADWELQVGEDDEIPEEMIEIEDLEYEPCSRGRRGYRGISSFSSTSQYTLTGYSEEDLESQDITGPPRFSTLLSSRDGKEMEFKEPTNADNWSEDDGNMKSEQQALQNEDKNTTQEHSTPKVAEIGHCANSEEEKACDPNEKSISLTPGFEAYESNHVTDKLQPSPDHDSNEMGHHKEFVVVNGFGTASKEDMSLVSKNELVSDSEAKSDTTIPHNNEGSFLECSNSNTSGHLQQILHVSPESLPHGKFSQLEQNENAKPCNTHGLESSGEETEFADTADNSKDSVVFNEFTNGSIHTSSKDHSFKPNSSTDDSDFYDDDDVLRKIAASMINQVKNIETSYGKSEEDMLNEMTSDDLVHPSEKDLAKVEIVYSVLNGRLHNESKHALPVIAEISECDSLKESQLEENENHGENNVTPLKVCNMVKTNDCESNGKVDCDSNAFKTEMFSAVPIPITTIASNKEKPEEFVVDVAEKVVHTETKESSDTILPVASFSNEVSSQNSSFPVDLLDKGVLSLEQEDGRSLPSTKLTIDSMSQEDAAQSLKLLPIPSIIVTDAEDLSSSDDELGDFLAEHLKLYKQEETDLPQGFEVTPDFSESPFEDTFGYTSGLSTMENNSFIEAVNFACGNSEDSSFS